MTTTATKYGLSTEVIEKICAVFKNHPEISKAVLYGSRAMASYKSSSDIDLSLFSSNTDLSFLFKIETELDDLLLPYKIDLSLFSLLDNENLKEHILRVGIDFYHRD